jgi:hypothetical protein
MMAVHTLWAHTPEALMAPNAGAYRALEACGFAPDDVYRAAVREIASMQAMSMLSQRSDSTRAAPGAHQAAAMTVDRGANPLARDSVACWLFGSEKS